MQVQQIMTSEIATCRPETNLAIVAKLMWERDCGFVPVVAADGTLKGVVSMNDIVLASQRKDGPTAADIVSTLSVIRAHQPTKVAAA